MQVKNWILGHVRAHDNASGPFETDFSFEPDCINSMPDCKCAREFEGSAKTGVRYNRANTVHVRRRMQCMSALWAPRSGSFQLTVLISGWCPEVFLEKTAASE